MSNSAEGRFDSIATRSPVRRVATSSPTAATYPPPFFPGAQRRNVVTDGVDVSPSFMPGCAGWQRILKPRLTLPYRQVRSAHTATLDANPDLAGLRIEDRCTSQRGRAGLR